MMHERGPLRGFQEMGNWREKNVWGEFMEDEIKWDKMRYQVGKLFLQLTAYSIFRPQIDRMCDTQTPGNGASLKAMKRYMWLANF